MLREAVAWMEPAAKVRAPATAIESFLEHFFRFAAVRPAVLVYTPRCCPPPAINASMSCLLIRPPAPVPATPLKSMPCSLAMRRTSGEL